MSQLPEYFYEKMNTLLDNQPNQAMYLIRNCYLVGSTVASNLINLENDNDIDIYYYEYGPKRNKNMMKLYKLLSASNLDQICEVDLLSFIITDKFYSSEKKCLTDYIFGEKKEVFSNKVGTLRALNLDGFFLTKLATRCCRNEQRDKNAIKAVLDNWDNTLPKEVQVAIDNYYLSQYYEEFK
ncbi:MAG: hypothetical protein PHN56_03545 [Candidatus Nanoarchaeia archaeon]|nr:hypothetical protein [Candidatus Nanoarchaeia archaeon]